MPERANPDTCEHRVLWKSIATDLDGVCVSCDSTISPEWAGQQHWEYDIVNNCWVWQGPCDCKD